MCDIKPTICMTSYEFYVTSQPLFMTSQDCIHDITSTLYFDITAIVTMTRHLLYIIISVYDISHAEWMRTQQLYLTWYPMYLCNQTHLIDDITPYVHMKSHPLHVWHHRHFIWHHIHSCWQHTIVFMSWHTFCLWHHMYYIWCHSYCVYDYSSSISDLKPVKTAISSLYMSSHPLCRRHHTYCVSHQSWHMYAITCVIQNIISTLYDNNP